MPETDGDMPPSSYSHESAPIQGNASSNRFNFFRKTTEKVIGKFKKTPPPVSPKKILIEPAEIKEEPLIVREDLQEEASSEALAPETQIQEDAPTENMSIVQADADEVINITPFSSAEKRHSIEELEERNIYDYEPCALSADEMEDFKSKILQKSDTESDGKKKELYTELLTFVTRNGAIFPEFSHGTSGGTKSFVKYRGILPRNMVLENKETPIYGEGAKGGPGEKYENKTNISAGVGLGGLGTAIAYAQATEDPYWNPAFRLPTETRQEIKKVVAQLSSEEVPPEEKEQLIARKTKLEEDYEFYTYLEFPIVYGFNHSQAISDVHDPNLSLITSQLGSKRSMIASGDYGSLDSEAFLPEGDIVPPNAVTVVACPSKEKEKVENHFYPESGVQVVSLEMFDLLPELGIQRVEEGRKRAESILKLNSMSHFFRDQLR